MCTQISQAAMRVAVVRMIPSVLMVSASVHLASPASSASIFKETYLIYKLKVLLLLIIFIRMLPA